MQESSQANIPKVDVKLDLDDRLTREEIKNMKQLKVGKSSGIDGIPAEVYQYVREALLDKIWDLFSICWKKGTAPKGPRDAVCVSLQKPGGGGWNQTVQTTATSLCSPLQAES